MDQELPSIEELFPYEVRLKHKGEMQGVALAVMKHLEGQGIMVHTHFYLNMMDDPERIVVSFRKKKHAKAFKAVKKAVRNSVCTK